MLDAGRGLDAIVAAKVFSLVVDWEFDEPRSKALADKYDEMGWLPGYSTYMGDAWDVVVRMREQGFHLLMNDTLAQYRAQFFTVHNSADSMLWRRLVEDGTHYSFADTAPHAICLAALRVVGYTDA